MIIIKIGAIASAINKAIGSFKIQTEAEKRIRFHFRRIYLRTNVALFQIEEKSGTEIKFVQCIFQLIEFISRHRSSLTQFKFILARVESFA